MRSEIDLVDIELLTDWQLIADMAAFTQGMKSFEINEQFLRDAIISRHSIIRAAIFRITVFGIPYFSHVHFVRHSVGHDHFVRSQRPDSMNPVGYNRETAPQNAPVDWSDIINMEALFTMMGRRLCKQADPVTRSVAQEIKWSFLNHRDAFMNLVGEYCLPLCEWMGGYCPETFRSCQKYPIAFKERNAIKNY